MPQVPPAPLPWQIPFNVRVHIIDCRGHQLLRGLKKPIHPGAGRAAAFAIRYGLRSCRLSAFPLGFFTVRSASHVAAGPNFPLQRARIYESPPATRGANSRSHPFFEDLPKLEAVGFPWLNVLDAARPVAPTFFSCRYSLVEFLRGAVRGRGGDRHGAPPTRGLALALRKKRRASLKAPRKRHTATEKRGKTETLRVVSLSVGCFSVAF